MKIAKILFIISVVINASQLVSSEPETNDKGKSLVQFFGIESSPSQQLLQWLQKQSTGQPEQKNIVIPADDAKELQNSKEEPKNIQRS